MKIIYLYSDNENGRIQISQDDGITWEDLKKDYSGYFSIHSKLRFYCLNYPVGAERQSLTVVSKGSSKELASYTTYHIAPDNGYVEYSLGSNGLKIDPSINKRITIETSKNGNNGIRYEISIPKQVVVV